LQNNERFVIEKSNEWKDCNVIKFCVANSYPINKGHVYFGDPEDRDKASLEKNNNHDYKLALHYNLENQSIISSCLDWCQLIRQEISITKQKQYYSR